MTTSTNHVTQKAK